jgi:hypothetical protein
VDKRAAFDELERVLKEAEAEGAKPGDRRWQPKIDRAWRRALDAGVRCHIHEPGPGERWVLITDVGNDPELEPARDRR